MSQKPNQKPEHHSLLQSAVDLFVDRTRTLVDLMAGAGAGALGALPDPVPGTVSAMLASLRHLVEQAPPLTAEFEVIVQEVHAKRLSIEALQAELTALDNQLAVLEKSLAPVEAWARQWNRMRSSLSDALTRTDA